MLKQNWCNIRFLADVPISCRNICRLNAKRKLKKQSKFLFHFTTPCQPSSSTLPSFIITGTSSTYAQWSSRIAINMIMAGNTCTTKQTFFSREFFFFGNIKHIFQKKLIKRKMVCLSCYWGIHNEKQRTHYITVEKIRIERIERIGKCALL